MRLNALPLLAFLGLAASGAYAQAAGDGADLFLNAYMAFQKAERAESTGDSRSAMRSYNQAITLLDQVGQRWPGWNPAIVKHRRERAAEALTRLQATGSGTPAIAGLPDENILDGPPLPERGDILPPDSFPDAAPTRNTRRATSGDPIAEIQERMESLRTDLEEARKRLKTATDEKGELAKKLEEALKVAKSNTEKLAVVERRADLAEKALKDAEKTGTRSNEELEALRASVAKAKKEMRQLQFERDAEAELREQVAGRYRAVSRKVDSLTQDRDGARKETADFPKRMQEMQKEIDTALREKGELETKLTKVEAQLKEVTEQRNEAQQQLAKMREAQKNVDKLLTENTTLMAKLSDAEKQITALKADGTQKDAEIKRLNTEMTSVRQQLAAAQKQSGEYQTQMTELRKQLEAQSKEFAMVKADASKSIAEQKRMFEENNLLRGIILRQQKEQANREQVKKLVLDQLAKLEVNSKALSNQIEMLGSPIVKLTEREKKLFKEPVLSINDAEITFGASAEPSVEAPAPAAPEPPPIVADAKPAPAAPASEAKPNDPAPAPARETAPLNAAADQPVIVDAAPTPLPDEMPALSLDGGTKNSKNATPQLELASAPQRPGIQDKLPGKSDPLPSIEGDLPAKEPVGHGPETIPGPGVKTNGDPAVPAEIVGICRDAKDHFERGNYRDAEKAYEKALAKAPNNLYVLSNLGVVRFRAQKYKLAEEAFVKAIAIAPEDDFSHCTLGIIKYSQGKFDNAIDELTKALALNPKNATAHNYLGITASQKGWQEAAQKELETATALDPNYADAHFNLAVVFATQTPPNKESARQHYKRAIELGAEPDSALEQLIK